MIESCLTLSTESSGGRFRRKSSSDAYERASPPETTSRTPPFEVWAPSMLTLLFAPWQASTSPKVEEEERRRQEGNGNKPRAVLPLLWYIVDAAMHLFLHPLCGLVCRICWKLLVVVCRVNKLLMCACWKPLLRFVCSLYPLCVRWMGYRL